MICTCPFTHRNFNAEPLEAQELDGWWFVQVRCTWCDAAGNIKGEPGYDAGRPQVHTMKLNNPPNERECNA